MLFLLVKTCQDHVYEEKIDTINPKIACSTETLEYKTDCNFTCPLGYRNIGSQRRYCLANGFWSGLTPKCKSNNFFKDL